MSDTPDIMTPLSKITAQNTFSLSRLVNTVMAMKI